MLDFGEGRRDFRGDLARGRSGGIGQIVPRPRVVFESLTLFIGQIDRVLLSVGELLLRDPRELRPQAEGLGQHALFSSARKAAIGSSS